MINFSFRFFLGISVLLIVGCREGLFQSEPCEKGTVREGNLCVSETNSQIDNCVDPDLSGVKKGVQLTLCDGSLVEGTLVDCVKDGEQNCVAKSSLKAVDVSSITPSEIKLGKVLAGVSGVKREIKDCRNSANLSYFDLTPLDADKKLPNEISSAPGGNAVQLVWNHGLAANDPVQIYCTGGTGTTLAGGVVTANTTYYAAIVSVNQIQFQASPSSGALNVTGVTGCTGGTWVISSPADSFAGNEDTLDDFNGLSTNSTAPQHYPWGIEYVCDERNFTNVTSQAPLEPSNSTPSNANQVWSQIWRDELTGLFFSNVLYDGTANTKDWFEINLMCKNLDSLNGGSGGTGWRLPTQKELMQLYINGISKVSLAGSSLNLDFWSSSGLSYTISHAWTVNLARGESGSAERNLRTKSAICVR